MKVIIIFSWRYYALVAVKQSTESLLPTIEHSFFLTTDRVFVWPVSYLNGIYQYIIIDIITLKNVDCHPVLVIINKVIVWLMEHFENYILLEIPSKLNICWCRLERIQYISFKSYTEVAISSSYHILILSKKILLYLCLLLWNPFTQLNSDRTKTMTVPPENPPSTWLLQKTNSLLCTS